MMSCGTTSNEVEKKSKPCWCASASSSATRSSNMGVLLRPQKGLQHVIQLFLVRDGHAQQAGMVDLLESVLQGAEGKRHLAPPAIKAGIVLVPDFAIANHVAV